MGNEWIILIAIILLVIAIITWHKRKKKKKEKRKIEKQQKIVMIVAALCSVVIKAEKQNGRIKLQIVKDFLAKKMNKSFQLKTLGKIRHFLFFQQEINIRKYCLWANRTFSYSTRFSLCNLLFNIATVGEGITDEEEELLTTLMQYLAMKSKERKRLWQTYGKYLVNKDKHIDRQNKKYEEAYKILGLENGADDKAIKKAYRKLCVIYHPDNQKNVDEKTKIDCTVKMQQIIDAYNILSKRIHK